MTASQRTWLPFLKKTTRWVLSGVLLPVFLIILGNVYILQTTKKQVYSHTTELEVVKTGLVFGTSPYTPGGYQNPFFIYRIQAAAELFHAGKVRHLLVSGDNSNHQYNEPLKMQQALLKAGVPESAITLDYAGFRTLDSVIRAKKVFGQSKVILITQEFHLYRALFLANYAELHAQGYIARGVSWRYGLKTYMREYLARIKALLDVFIFKTPPRFLGDPVHID